MFKKAQDRFVGSRHGSRYRTEVFRRRFRPACEFLEGRLAPATFTVLNANDSGAGSLRQAVLDAAGNAVADLIQFDASLAGQTITLTTNDANTGFGPTGLVIANDTLTLDGGSAPGLQISGGNARRVFAVAATGNLTLQRITITGGRAQGGTGGRTTTDGGGGGGGAGLGGAIFNEGTLTVVGTTLTGNAAQGGNGGTAFLGSYGGGGGGGGRGGNGGNGSGSTPGAGGTLGGGAGGEGSTSQVGSPGTFGGGGGGGGGGPFGGAGGAGGFGGGGGGGGNTAISSLGGFGAGGGGASLAGGGGGGGGAGLGGAIFNYGGTVTLTISTISDNTAQGGAGGNSGFGGFGGSGLGLGGGVFNLNGTVTITNATIAFNVAGYDGGAIYNLSHETAGGVTAAAATLTLRNTIAANAVVSGGIGIVVNHQRGGALGATTDATAPNLVEGGIGNNGGTVNGTPLTGDPALGALANNGGPTQTRTLNAGSVARNAGSNAVATAAGLTTDQRGTGFARIDSGTVDLGAVEVDGTAPLVNAIDRVGASATSAASVQFIVTFNEVVTGVQASNFTLAVSGVTGALITSVSGSGSGSAWTVTVNTGSGDGTISLNLTSAAGITDASGNALTGVPFTGQVYTIDKTAPVIQSVVRVSPAATNAASVQFTVTFGEAVLSVQASNFALAVSGVTGAAINSVSGGGTTWTVTVNTGSGDGTLGLNLSNGTGIADAAGNGPAGVPFTGQVYTIDKTAPTVAVSSPAPALTNTSPMVVTVTFSEAVTGFIASDLTIGNGMVSNFTGSGTTYTFSLTPSGQGLVDVSIAAGVSADVAGNSNAAAAAFTRTFDSIAPTVTVNQAAGQADPAATGAIQFTVVFSEAITGFVAADVVLGGTAGATTAIVSGSGTAYTVTVIGMTRGGTVIVTIGAGAASDAAGNGSDTSTSTDNSVTFATDSTFNGVVFEDFNNDGVRQAGEAAQGGVPVYVDLDGDGVFDANEPAGVSGADGSYRLTVTTQGSFTVRLVLPERWRQTTGDGPLSSTLVGGEALAGVNVGVLPAASVVPVVPFPSLYPTVPGSAVGAWLTGVYRSVLNRDPEPAALTGFEALLNQGVTHQQVAQIIWQSVEHRGLQVESYYQSYLGRAADAAGKAAWVSLFLTGASEADVVLGFVTSAEYQALYSTDAAYARSLYTELLGRGASAAEESTWVQALQGGVSRAAAARAFLVSDELYGLAVDAFYSAYLHREGDAAGEAFWLNLPRTGRALETIGVGILASGEFVANAQKSS